MNILFFILKTKLLLKRVFGKETEMRTLLGTMNEEIEGQRIFLVGKLSFKRIA